MRILMLFLATALSAVPARAQHAHSDDPASDLELSVATRAELDAVRAAVARYQDHAAAVADGYRHFGGKRGPENPLMGEHWHLRDAADQPLDLERPSALIYATIDGKRRLVGVAWAVYRRPNEPLPEGFPGDADHWHVHHVDQLAAATASGRPLLERIVERRRERGSLGADEGRTELTMLHAWTGLENPAGTFANDNPALPYARMGLPVEWASADLPAAARGVGLLLPEACEERPASEACEEAAATVGAALEQTLAGEMQFDAFNAVASKSWRDYSVVALAALTPEERAQRRAMRAATTH